MNLRLEIPCSKIENVGECLLYCSTLIHMNKRSSLANIQVSSKVLSSFRQNMLLRHTEVLSLSYHVEFIFKE